VGIISPKPVSAYDLLVQSRCSLLEQAKVGNQGDGWGVGYYVDGELRVLKSPGAAYLEEDAFKKVARSVRSRIIVAHVRKASNPRGLPRELLISMENTQPFSHGSFVFAHNGVIYVPDEALERLEPEYRKLVKGLNDSEVYFALLLMALDNAGDVADALRMVEEELQEAVNVCGRGVKKPYSSLNAVFSDGERLYAYNRYLSDDGESLCLKDQPYYQMVYARVGDGLVVASEKIGQHGWTEMHNGELLEAYVVDGRVEWVVRRL